VGWLRGCVHDRSDVGPVLLKQISYRRRIANIDVVMLVIAHCLQQMIARFFCRSFRAEELTAHVVIDPDDAHLFFREMFDRLGPD
jgi:hypothetical protein